MSDQESQEDELLALASIYDDDTFVCCHDEASPCGHFTTHLQLPQPFSVVFSQKDGVKQEYNIQHLPPLVLHFDIPVDYPSVSAPRFTLSAKWLTLSQLTLLCQRLDEIAQENEGEVLLFLWTSFLQDETLEYLDITSPLDLSNVVTVRKNLVDALKFDPKCDKENKEGVTFGAVNEPSKMVTVNLDSHNIQSVNLRRSDCADSGRYLESNENSLDSDRTKLKDMRSPDLADMRAVQDIGSQELLLPTILDHDQQRRERVFQTTLFTCQVCFLEKLGDICLTFVGCNHVYCKECMRGYFELQIKEGNVSALTCPSEDCDTQALPTQVRELVSNELYARYDRLLLQLSLDTMSDVMYCPRTCCGSVVLVDSDNNTGSCTMCHFVFCIFCKKVYHGVSPCRIKPNEVKKIRTQYESASAAEKRLLEKRYGVRMIRGLIEDSYTADWLQENSKQCPSCLTHIQKIDGCNKMTCTKCRSFFCWLCGVLLSRHNPYLHFNHADSRCFNQLFAGVLTDGMDDFDEEYEFWR